MRIERDRPRADGGVGTSSLAMLFVLALGLGFLACNFSHIMIISKEVIVESLQQDHQHVRDFCSYTKCHLRHKMMHSMDDSSSPGALVAVNPFQDIIWPQVSKEAHANLTARTCVAESGKQPQVSCLEASPTNYWWQRYFALGNRRTDLLAYIEKAAHYQGTTLDRVTGQPEATVEDCAAACMKRVPTGQRLPWKEFAEQRIPDPKGPLAHLPCNAFAWCGAEECEGGPPETSNKKGDCWLMFMEGPGKPQVQSRSRTVPWSSGVLLPGSVQPDLSS